MCVRASVHAFVKVYAGVGMFKSEFFYTQLFTNWKLYIPTPMGGMCNFEKVVYQATIFPDGK